MLSEKAPQTPRTILLIEDNQAHAELVMRSLAEHRTPNAIVHLSDSETALDYLFQRGSHAAPEISPRPDVILLDLRLPKIDGLTVLKEIKMSQALQSVPVVILTTSHAERDVAQAYADHANSYVVKPLGLGEFAQLMDDLGIYWLGWNYPPQAQTP